MTRPEKRLGGCRIVRVQSRSERSLLYRAYSEELGRPVMIKVLDPRYPPGSRTAKRFLRGGAIARSLDQPHIVHTFAAGCERRAHYMMMDFLPGHSLDRVLNVRERLSVSVACDIIRQVAQALEYAASRNVVHRNIEPAHVMLSPGGRISVLGFGLARLSEAQDQAITAEGALVGIGPYSPPEAGEGVPDIRGDLYSLGVVLYHMLAGRPPFEGQDPLELLHQHRREPPWPLRDLAGKELPQEIEDIVDGLLEKDPIRRIQTPSELIACIDAYTRPDLVGESTEERRQRQGETLVITTREMLSIRHQRTVVLCDEQSYNTQLLGEVLRRLGFNVLALRDASAALEAVRNHRPDLLLTDLKLPGMQDAEFLRSASRGRPGLPIGLTRGGELARSLKGQSEMNIRFLLERPLDPHEVREAVKGVLD
jgi:serine/threonine protein kinase